MSIFNMSPCLSDLLTERSIYFEYGYSRAILFVRSKEFFSSLQWHLNCYEVRKNGRGRLEIAIYTVIIKGDK